MATVSTHRSVSLVHSFGFGGKVSPLYRMSSAGLAGSSLQVAGIVNTTTTSRGQLGAFQRSKGTVQPREHWRALCLVTGTTLPRGPGVLFEFILSLNNHCVSSLHQAEFSGADFSTRFCLYQLGDEFPIAELNQPLIKESIRTQHVGLFLLTHFLQSSTFVQCPSYRRCK